MKWAVIIVFLLVVGAMFSRCGGKSDAIDTVATPITATVNKIYIAEDYYNRKVQLKTQLYYRANGYRRGWLKKRRPDKVFEAFIEEVQESSRYGFNPQTYHVGALEAAVESLYDDRNSTDADMAELDIRITAAFFLFTTHLLEGRIRYPGAREFLWKRGTSLENDIALLLKIESAADLRKQLNDLHPKDTQYKRLQGVLEDYRKLVDSDTFPPIPAKLNIEPGDVNDAVPLLRKKLSLTDFKGDENDTSTCYDERLQKAVQKFQERHGLRADGVVEDRTIRFLNQTMRQKVELISLNLPLQVELERPYPVYIIYRTSWVDDEGVVHFRDDIYGHDERQLALLDK